MSTINDLWFAMLTRSVENAGTDSAVNLVVTQGGNDRLNHSFSENTPQEDQERGQANLYNLDVRGGILIKTY